jgi:hypothetical protein
VPIARYRSSTRGAGFVALEAPDLWLPHTRADVRHALPRGTQSGPGRRIGQAAKSEQTVWCCAGSGAGTDEACDRGLGGDVDEGREEVAEGEKAMGSSLSWWGLEGAGQSVEGPACVRGARPYIINVVLVLGSLYTHHTEGYAAYSAGAGWSIYHVFLDPGAKPNFR